MTLLVEADPSRATPATRGSTALLRRVDWRGALFLVPILAVVLLVVVSGRGPSGAPDLPASPGSSQAAASAVPNVGAQVSPLTMPSKVPEGTTVTAPDPGYPLTSEQKVALDRVATIKAYRAAQEAGVDLARRGSNNAPGVASPGGARNEAAQRGPAPGVDATVATSDLGGGLPVGSFITLALSLVVVGVAAALAFRRRRAQVSRT